MRRRTQAGSQVSMDLHTAVSVARAQEAIEETWLSCPRLFEHLPWNASRCIAQGKRHDDDVIERTDDWQELRDQIDRRHHPQPREDECGLGSHRDLRITT